MPKLKEKKGLTYAQKKKVQTVMSKLADIHASTSTFKNSTKSYREVMVSLEKAAYR